MEGMPIILVMVCALACVVAMNPKICLLALLGFVGLVGLYYVVQAAAPLIPVDYAVIAGVAGLLGVGIGVFLGRLRAG